MNPSLLPTVNQPKLQVSSGMPNTSNLPVTGPAPTPTPPTDLSQTGNWFVRNAPAIGGVLGGLATAPLELANLVAPGTGVALNVAGAAGGQALGEALKQRLQGRELSPSEIAKQGLIGGAAQGVGEIAGIVAKPVLSKAGEALSGVSRNLLKGAFPKGAVDTMTAAELQKAGLFGANQIDEVARVITGAEGKIPTFVKDTLAATRQNVDATPLYRSLEELMIDNQGQFASDTTAKNLRNQLTRMLTQASGGTGMQIGKAGVQIADIPALKNLAPEQAWNLMKSFEAQAQKAATAGAFSKVSPQPAQRALYNVYSGLAAEAERLLFNNTPLTSVMKSNLIEELGSLKSVNPTAYNYFVNKIADPATQFLSDLRTVQAPVVRGSIALQKGAEIAEKAGGITAGQAIKQGAQTIAPFTALASGNIPLAAGLSTIPLAESELGTRLLGQGLGKAGATLQPAGAIGRVAPTLARMTALGAVKAPGVLSTMEQGAPSMDNVPLPGGLPTGGAPLTTGAMGAGAPAAPEAAGGISPSMLGSLLTLGYANPSFLTSLGLTGEQRTKLGQVSQADAALNNLEKSFTTAGGGKGGIAGRFEKVTSKVAKGKVSAFEDQRAATANQIALATGLDSKTVLESMPDVTDTKEGASAKLNQLRGLVASARQGAQVTGLGATGVGGLLGGMGAGGQFNYPSSALPTIPGLSQ